MALEAGDNTQSESASGIPKAIFVVSIFALW